MNLTSRRALAAGLLLTAAAVAGVTSAPGASAHPLGNFTVNHHTGLTLHQDRVDALLVVDRAEIAAAQELPGVDRDGNGAV
ncbi:nickel transporter, partial [Streptomyces sp. 4R-3d]